MLNGTAHLGSSVRTCRSSLRSVAGSPQDAVWHLDGVKKVISAVAGAVLILGE